MIFKELILGEKQRTGDRILYCYKRLTEISGKGKQDMVLCKQSRQGTV